MRYLLVLLLTGCSGFRTDDVQKWNVTFDVYQDDNGNCVVNFDAGEHIEFIHRDVKIEGPSG